MLIARGYTNNIIYKAVNVKRQTRSQYNKHYYAPIQSNTDKTIAPEL